MVSEYLSYNFSAKYTSTHYTATHSVKFTFVEELQIVVACSFDEPQRWLNLSEQTYEKCNLYVYPITILCALGNLVENIYGINRFIWLVKYQLEIQGFLENIKNLCKSCLL